MIGRVSSPTFVGRREELGALADAVSAAAAGSESVVLISGEPGIGKSRLISEFAARSHASGATVLVGECPPLGHGELPYSPIITVLRVLNRSDQRAGPGRVHSETDELLSELTVQGGETVPPVVGDGSQARLFERLLAVLLNASTTGPVVLIVEDLQRADRSTRDFLTFAVRAARPERLALIGTYRSDEVHGRRHPVRPFIHELARSGQATRLELAPFTRKELRDQIAAITGETPDPILVDRLLARSEGNPLFAEELLASARANAGLPESLKDALLWRLESVPPDVRDVLVIAAVAGRTVDDALLAAVAGLANGELTAALHAAVDGNILTHDPESTGYSFRHALLREAIYGDLLPRERRALHTTVAETLTRRPELAGSAAPAELAYHWHAAGRLPEALRASVEAGLSAERIHAVAEALMHYEQALEMWDAAGDVALPVDRVELTRRAADAALLTGDYDRAIALATEVIDRTDEQAEPARAALAHARLGHTLWHAGQGEKPALLEYDRATTLMPVEPPSAERAFVLAAEAQLLLRCNRREASAARCEQALEVAREVGAPAVEAHVLNTSCPNLGAVGEFDRAVESAAQARAIARRLGLAEEIGRSYINGSDALDHAGRVEQSIALAREGIEACRELGIDRRFGDCLRCEIAGRLLRDGRWAEAAQLVEHVLDRGPTGLNQLIACETLGRLLAERGELEAARRALDRAARLLENIKSSVWIGPIVEGRATAELWAGRPAAADALLTECLALVEDSEHVFYTARLYELSVRACAELAGPAPGAERARRDQVTKADALLDRLDGLLAELSGSPPPRVLASRAAALAERSRIGDHGDPGLWGNAEALWDACGDRYLAAYAAWRQAEALLALGADRRDVETRLRRAMDVAGELDARPLREELEALARRARIDLDEAADASPVVAALTRLELTPREIDVLALIADGKTNRQIATELFISNKTASAHVSHILSKLSVHNRTAAAATARRLGLGREG
ncbi:MAG: helix-turn-helix transcriptional regulator [Solirubrobacteraceae bacterium]